MVVSVRMYLMSLSTLPTPRDKTIKISSYTLRQHFIPNSLHTHDLVMIGISIVIANVQFVTLVHSKPMVLVS